MGKEQSSVMFEIHRMGIIFEAWGHAFWKISGFSTLTHDFGLFGMVAISLLAAYSYQEI